VPQLFRTACKCGEPRFIGSSQFYLDKRKGLPRTMCKACCTKEGEAWRKANPAAHRAGYTRRNHIWNLRIRFNLTTEEFEALAAKSDGRCGICREPESRSRRLSLDHDHKTGELRGFLCSRCNLLLGNARDRIDLLLRAAEYLRSARLQRPTVTREQIHSEAIVIA
jgi:hypothetical protein